MRMIFAAAALAISPFAASAADTAPAAQTPAARLNLDTPVEAIVGDAAGKAVLDADLPELAAHPQYEMFKGMSLRQLSSIAPDKLSAEILARIEADLAAIK
ncbi:hypothetical protein GCM10011515_24120 [Tsuneonella deserti]|uniref:Peptidylprolyl isomerase n=1 Tax=Tsuneonella deserti TaxID=2035528 RepID=A0ABQ1SAF0_9SPHN|nr:hypothetical protein [Tsuneonella deserti]GGE03692.1 hypothetical protein GCM10011515_24120 [Tsuneonella deserti]